MMSCNRSLRTTLRSTCQTFTHSFSPHAICIQVTTCCVCIYTVYIHMLLFFKKHAIDSDSCVDQSQPVIHLKSFVIESVTCSVYLVS